MAINCYYKFFQFLNSEIARAKYWLDFWKIFLAKLLCRLLTKNVLFPIYFQQLNDRLQDEGEKRSEKTKKRLHQRFSVFLPEELDIESEEEEESPNSEPEEGEEYSLDDILDAEDPSSPGDPKMDVDSQSISSFSSRKSLTNEHRPPVPRSQSSQPIKVRRETSFQRRQLSAPAEMAPADQVTSLDSIILLEFS